MKTVTSGKEKAGNDRLGILIFFILFPPNSLHTIFIHNQHLYNSIEMLFSRGMVTSTSDPTIYDLLLMQIQVVRISSCWCPLICLETFLSERGRLSCSLHDASLVTPFIHYSALRGAAHLTHINDNHAPKVNNVPQMLIILPPIQNPPIKYCTVCFVVLVESSKRCKEFL